LPLTFNAIFLGNTATRIDPTEGDQDAENANLLVGQTFGSTADSLAARWVSFTSVNRGGNATALDQNNNVVNDRATINNGSGPVTYTFDATSIYQGVLTYMDGTSSATLDLVLVQMTNGDLYLVPSPTAGTPTNIALTVDAVRAVTLTGLVGNTYTGMGIDRPVLNFIPCFTRGTRIATPDGDRPVERIRPGDWLSTLDNGPQQVRWVGMRRIEAAEIRANPRLWPVRIAAGALGPGMPHADLVVSQQHRILVRSPIAMRMTGKPEVLVAARHLVGLPGIDLVRDAQHVEYWHILLDRHEVLMADGAAAESLYLGEQVQKALGDAARSEIALIMPELFGSDGPAAPPKPARILLPGRQARRMAERHEMNDRQLFQPPIAA
jgi:hypothetical protein